MMDQIPFNIPPHAVGEMECISDTVGRQKISGDGHYTRLCSKFFEDRLNVPKVLLTTSCTHALEMSALLLGIEPGDEVIMPSFTFTSTANAFALRGAKIVFTDIRPDTQNIDENKIEQAITKKTRAIVPVHYAGVSCEMDRIMGIARVHGIPVVEDAAQGVNAYYKDKPLGAIGDIGCFSFHETKNYSMGEGGAIVLGDNRYVQAAEIIREKGTNRSQFIQGLVDKYTWVGIGSSFLPSDLNAAYLYPQLLNFDNINDSRLAAYNHYLRGLSALRDRGLVELPVIPAKCRHNAHMFYIKTASIVDRSGLLQYLRDRGIGAAFHYIPLHSSPEGMRSGEFRGEDRHTTDTADRLLRLPMYYGLESDKVERVCECVNEFYMR